MFNMNKLTLPSGKYIICDPKLVLSDFDFNRLKLRMLEETASLKKPFILTGFSIAAYYSNKNDTLCKASSGVSIPVHSSIIAALPFGICDADKLCKALSNGSGIVVDSSEPIKCYAKKNRLVFGNESIDIKAEVKTPSGYNSPYKYISESYDKSSCQYNQY